MQVHFWKRAWKRVLNVPSHLSSKGAMWTFVVNKQMLGCVFGFTTKQTVYSKCLTTVFRCISCPHNKQSQFLWISKYYLIQCLHLCIAFPCTLLAHFCFYLSYYCQQLVNMCHPASGHPWNRTGHPKDSLSLKCTYHMSFWMRNGIRMLFRYVCVWVSALSSVPTSLKFTD